MSLDLARSINKYTNRWNRRTSVAHKLLPGDVIRYSRRDVTSAFIVTKVTRTNPDTVTVEVIGHSKPIRFDATERIHIDRRYPN